LPGIIAPHVKPEGILPVRATTPLKPFTDAIVIVDEAEMPALTGAGDPTVMVKSWTLKRAAEE
jgi:hypothetical protein